MLKNLFFLIALSIVRSDVIHYHFHGQQPPIQEIMAEHQGFNLGSFYGCKKACLVQHCRKEDSGSWWAKLKNAFDYKCSDEEQAAFDECVKCKCDHQCNHPANTTAGVNNLSATTTVRHLEDENPVF